MMAQLRPKHRRASKMKVELQILAKDAVHEQILTYEATPPLPLVGEDIVIELKRWTVKVREFGVFSNGSFRSRFGVKARRSFWTRNTDFSLGFELPR
jgi:hypothetical protein